VVRDQLSVANRPSNRDLRGLSLPGINDIFGILEVEIVLFPQTLNCSDFVAGMKVSLGFIDSVEKGERLSAVRAGLGLAAYLAFAGAA
jgi:hypothetical protein